MLGGTFVFEDDNAQLVIDALPAFMRIPAEQPAAAALRDILAMLDRESEHADMGGSLLMQRLADILLIQALRAYVAEHGASAAGWIGALSDPRIGGALTLMHGDVGHGWTVGELASAVAIPRSAFALRFKAKVGVAPLEYSAPVADAACPGGSASKIVFSCQPGGGARPCQGPLSLDTFSGS